MSVVWEKALTGWEGVLLFAAFSCDAYTVFSKVRVLRCTFLLHTVFYKWVPCIWLQAGMFYLLLLLVISHKNRQGISAGDLLAAVLSQGRSVSSWLWCVEEEEIPLPPYTPRVVVWATGDRLTGEKETHINCAHRHLIEMRPKKWPT